TRSKRDWSSDVCSSDLAKRGGTRSKTLTLPGTKQNNILFNHIFEIDADCTFNPNIKAACIIYQDSIEIFSGIFRLIQVNRTIDRSEERRVGNDRRDQLM